MDLPKSDPSSAKHSQGPSSFFSARKARRPDNRRRYREALPTEETPRPSPLPSSPISAPSPTFHSSRFRFRFRNQPRNTDDCHSNKHSTHSHTALDFCQPEARRASFPASFLEPKSSRSSALLSTRRPSLEVVCRPASSQIYSALYRASTTGAIPVWARSSQVAEFRGHRAGVGSEGDAVRELEVGKIVEATRTITLLACRAALSRHALSAPLALPWPTTTSTRPSGTYPLGARDWRRLWSDGRWAGAVTKSHFRRWYNQSINIVPGALCAKW